MTNASIGVLIGQVSGAVAICAGSALVAYGWPMWVLFAVCGAAIGAAGIVVANREAAR